MKELISFPSNEYRIAMTKNIFVQDTPREFGQKLWTLKQSCKKVENACYAISVRGTEIPKNHLADIFVKKDDDKHDDNYSSVDDFYCN